MEAKEPEAVRPANAAPAGAAAPTDQPPPGPGEAASAHGVANAFTALGLIALTLYAISAVSGGWVGLQPFLAIGVYLTAVATLVTYLMSHRVRRFLWILFTLGVIGYAGNAAAYTLAPNAAELSPSLYDLGLILFYPLALVSITGLARVQLPRLSATVWLDAAIGGVALSAVVTWALVSRIGESPEAAILGQLAYVIGDTLILGFLATLGVMGGWRIGPKLGVVLGATGLLVTADICFVLITAGGGPPLAVPLVLWPASMLLLARAPWNRPAIQVDAPHDLAWQRAIVPVGAAAAALVITVVADSGEVAGILAVVVLAAVMVRMGTSLIENTKLLRLIRRQAETDPLTGLGNHAVFHDALEGWIREQPERSLAVVLFDVDGFKHVNDGFGHAEGDRVLREVAGAIGRSARAGDHACRVGGDEFGLLLPDATVAIAEGIGERIRAAVESLQAGIGISFGIAEWPTHGPSKELLLMRADLALYEAKPEPADRNRLKGAAAMATMNGDSDRIAGFLAITREQLGMDIAYFSEFTDGQQVFRGLEGDAKSFGMRRGEGVPLEESYCMRVVEGRLPNVISDAKSDERVNSLAATEEANIGAYVGVPMRFSDGQLFGTLCCASHNPDPTLAQRDVDFMHVIARLLADQLERDERQSWERILETQTLSLSGLLAALDARDRYTGEHSKDVVRLAGLVARQLRLSEESMSEVEQVALLHDIGKIGIPDAILNKQGPLDDEEWRLMREHPEIGANLVAASEPIAHLAPMVRAEHERWDGTGYPDGLAGSEIPLCSRVVFVCDAYHAMTSDRPYRAAMSPEEARRELDANRGTQFDPEVVGALARVLVREPTNTTLPSRS